MVYKGKEEEEKEEEEKGGGGVQETVEAQKLYLSLLDWPIIELPRSCTRQSVLREKFTEHFLSNPFLSSPQQRGEEK